MKAIFEVKTIESDWAPPFKKNIYTEEYTPLLNEEFDTIQGNGNNESVFKVINATNESAKVEFSSLFTIKNPNEDDIANKILFLKKGEEKIIAYLWGEKGITKKIVYKGTPSTFETRAMEKEKCDCESGDCESETENNEEDSKEEKAEESSEEKAVMDESGIFNLF